MLKMYKKQIFKQKSIQKMHFLQKVQFLEEPIWEKFGRNFAVFIIFTYS